MKAADTFDLAQKDCLLGLFANKYKLYYPFFANTFPIAYHYSQLFENDDDVSSHLIKLDWSKHDAEFFCNVASKDNNIAFYATRPLIDEIVGLMDQTKYYFQYSLFSQYLPRYIFFDYGPYLKSLVFEKKKYGDKSIIDSDFPETIHLDNDLVSLIRREYDKFELITDTPREAKVIIDNFLSEIDFNDIEVSQSAFDPLRRATGLLRIYYSGAPRSILRLVEDRDSYIGFRLLQNNSELPIFFDTYMCTISSVSSDSSITEQLHRNIQTYHETLFLTAKDPSKFNYLHNLRLFYNDETTRLGEKKFKTDGLYAKCIYLHHKYNEAISSDDSRLIASDTPVMSTSGSETIPTHLHFGAGKIGIGLVIPLLNSQNRDSKIKTIIFQRKNADWAQLGQYSKVTIKTITNVKIDYTYYLDDGTPKGREDIINSVSKSSLPCIICTENFNAFGALMVRASSISTSLGSAQEQVMQCLPIFDQTVSLYPFENVPELKYAVIRNMSVSKMIIDRICPKVFTSDDCVYTNSEEFGEVIIFDEIGISHQLFMPEDGINLIIVNSHAEYEFYKKRKRYLVNSVHMLLAIYGYDLLQKKNIESENWNTQYLTILQSIVLAPNNEYYAYIDIFIKTQIIRMILETPLDTLKLIFTTDCYDTIFQVLYNYSKSVLKRIDGALDEIERVFNLKNKAKAKEKYDEHIELLRKFVWREREKIKSINLSPDFKPHINDIEQTIIEEIENKFVHSILLFGKK